jgi:hypothetical protein
MQNKGKLREWLTEFSEKLAAPGDVNQRPMLDEGIELLDAELLHFSDNMRDDPPEYMEGLLKLWLVSGFIMVLAQLRDKNKQEEIDNLIPVYCASISGLLDSALKPAVKQCLLSKNSMKFTSDEFREASQQLHQLVRDQENSVLREMLEKLPVPLDKLH